jgi:REP element-mobilizing transposase RayT
VAQPLVIAHHLIWTAYGCWLPNDPRGSGSMTIRKDVLAELGELHQGRKEVQPPAQELRRFYQQARDLLRHALLTFDQVARLEIGAAFAKVIEAERYTCYACTVMPDHVHLLLRNHKHSAETMIEALEVAGREGLIASGAREAEHPVWTAGGGWKVFLDHPDEVRRTSDYIEKNPLALGEAVQTWPFVTVYDGWPLHPGHSPESPYARRLRAAGRYP